MWITWGSWGHAVSAAGLGWGLKFCSSNKLSGVADAAGSWTTLLSSNESRWPLFLPPSLLEVIVRCSPYPVLRKSNHHQSLRWGCWSASANHGNSTVFTSDGLEPSHVTSPGQCDKREGRQGFYKGLPPSKQGALRRILALAYFEGVILRVTVLLLPAKGSSRWFLGPFRPSLHRSCSSFFVSTASSSWGLNSGIPHGSVLDPLPPVMQSRLDFYIVNSNSLSGH